MKKSGDSAARQAAARMNTYAAFVAAQHVFRAGRTTMRPAAMCTPSKLRALPLKDTDPMTLLAFALLCLLALALRRWKRRRLSHACVTLAVLLFFGVGCGLVPSWLMRGLQEDYATTPTVAWGERNAIVLLGAGTFRDPAHGTVEPSFFANGRILAAVAQYQSCHAAGHDCKVLASGGDPLHNGVAEATVYRDSLVRAGVPAADVIVEDRSLSTWHNAQYSKPLLDTYAPQRVVLVTSGLHMRRSLLYFAHFGIVPVPVRGDLVEPLWSVYPLSWNFTVADGALHEYVGIARYHVYNALGLNAPRVKG